MSAFPGVDHSTYKGKMNGLRAKVSRWGLPAAVIPLLGVLWPATIHSQERQIEEIVVTFNVDRLINKDMFVQYDGWNIYLPLTEVFRLLDLNIVADFRGQLFTGFVISPDQRYEIDLTRLLAKVRGREHRLLATDFVLAPRELYLRLELFKTLFDLEMEFSFSALQVRLALDKEFPAYKKLQRRRVQQKLRAKRVAELDVRHQPRQVQYFGGGVADWAVAGTPIGEGGQYYNLALGGMLLGGDLKIAGGGNSVTGLDDRQLNYKWHYYFDNSRYITQLDLGYIYTAGLLSRQLKGGLVTNRPQIQREYFQTIDLSGHLGEGWEVELYINNKLTDFAYTDQSGVYNFSVDIHYGVTEVILRMYGPNGEIRTEREYVDVPYSLLPRKAFEYTVAAGETDTYVEEDRIYAQTSGLYGVTDRLTLGIASDLPLSAGDGEKAIVAFQATGRVAGNLTTNVSIAPAYAASAAINFSQPSIIYVDCGYTRYFENEFRNPINRIHTLRLSASSPLKIGRRRYSMRYSVSWDKVPGFDLVNMNYGTSASLLYFHFNYIGRTAIKRYAARSVTKVASEILATPRFLRWLAPQLSVSYDHTLGQVSRYGVQWAKRLFRYGQISVSLSRNEIVKHNQVIVTFRLLTGFADFSSRLISSGGYTSMSQVQRGSIRYDQKRHRVRFDRRYGIGSGSVLVRPFLDDNYNGVLDKREELIPGLRATVEGSRARRSGGQQQYYYDNLQAYDHYLVRIDKYSLDDPWLKPTHENYEIFCVPNVVTAIDVPVVVSSEVSGRVIRQIDSLTAGQGGIRVMVLDLAKESVTEITSFSNGEYFYLGLIPGSYRAYIDREQLAKLGYSSQPEAIEFEVKPLEEGTSIEDIDFLLVPIP